VSNSTRRAKLKTGNSPSAAGRQQSRGASKRASEQAASQLPGSFRQLGAEWVTWYWIGAEPTACTVSNLALIYIACSEFGVYDDNTTFRTRWVAGQPVSPSESVSVVNLVSSIQIRYISQVSYRRLPREIPTLDMDLLCNPISMANPNPWSCSISSQLLPADLVPHGSSIMVFDRGQT
jgi:hypothetical protein